MTDAHRSLPDHSSFQENGVVLFFFKVTDAHRSLPDHSSCQENGDGLIFFSMKTNSVPDVQHSLPDHSSFKKMEVLFILSLGRVETLESPVATQFATDSTQVSQWLMSHSSDLY